MTYTEETALEIIETLWDQDYTVYKKGNQLRVTPLGGRDSVYVELNDVLVFCGSGFSHMSLEVFNQNYEPCSPNGHTYGGSYGI
jgi:hypothetical protein